MPFVSAPLAAGLSGHTTKAHVVRAALESVAYQSKELLDCMQRDATAAFGAGKAEGAALKVDGGMTANDMLMQFQSDMTGRRVVRPVVAETTALGAAYAAGLAVGYWKDLDELKVQWKKSKEWEPKMPKEQVSQLLGRWDTAVQRTYNWKASTVGTMPKSASKAAPVPPVIPSLAGEAKSSLRSPIALAAAGAVVVGFGTMAFISQMGKTASAGRPQQSSRQQ